MRTSCRAVSGLVLILGILTSSCREKVAEPNPPAASNARASFAVISGLTGTVSPCRCGDAPDGGGLAALVGEVERLQTERARKVLVVGDTFYELLDPPSDRLDSEAKKAGFVRDILKELEVSALATGERDELAGGSGWRQLLKESGLPHMIFSRVRDSHGAIDSRIIEMGGVKVGIIGASGKNALNQPKLYTEAALAIRAQGAHVVVGLLPTGGERAAQFTTFVDAIDVMVAGGTEEPKDPTVLGGTLLLQGLNKGREVGLLEVHRRVEGGFVFDDGGAALRRTLESRIQSLRTMVETLEEGPERVERQVALEALVQELKNLKVKAPDGNFIRWSTVDVSETPTSNPELLKRVKALELPPCVCD